LYASSSPRESSAAHFRSGPLTADRGFTLLEVLIAVTLMALLFSALYGSYFAVIRARDRASDGMETRRELGATLDLLRREIASARFVRGDKQLRFVVEDRDVFGQPASNLELTTLAPPADPSRRESGVVNVRYRVAEKERLLSLTRQERDVLVESSASPAYPQMEALSSFLVECYDGSKWVKSWDTALNGTLPRLVRVTVQFVENGTPQEFFLLAGPKVTQ